MIVSGNYDFEVIYKIAENTKNLPVLRFIIQPIIENAILHGFKNDDLLKPNKLKIESYILDNTLYIEVYDNGQGMTEEECAALLNEDNKNTRNEIRGIGFINVKERINLVYKEKGKLVINSKKGEFTKVIFSFDIETSEKNLFEVSKIEEVD